MLPFSITLRLRKGTNQEETSNDKKTEDMMRGRNTKTSCMLHRNIHECQHSSVSGGSRIQNLWDQLVGVVGQVIYAIVKLHYFYQNLWGRMAPQIIHRSATELCPCILEKQLLTGQWTHNS
jgi:hypothetical protein